jgi:hypothetical protein
VVRPGSFRPHPEYIAVLVAQSSIAILVDMSTKYIAIQVSQPCIAVTVDCSPKFIHGVVVVPLAHLNIAWWRRRIRKRSAIRIRHVERRWFNGDVPAIVLRKRLTRYQDRANDANQPSFAMRHNTFFVIGIEKYVTSSGVTSELSDPRRCEHQEDIVSKI